MSEKLEKKTEFDADVSPDNPINIKAAKERRLVYNSRKRVYVDEDGCPQRDRFGQVLG